MKQLLLLLFTLCTISASAQKPVIVNDKNGDKRISIGDVAYTIDAIKKDNDSFSLNDVYAVAKRVLGKRNVLVVKLTSGILELYYLKYDPFIRYENDDIIISTSSNEEIAVEYRHQSDEVLSLTYEYVQMPYEYVDLGLPSGTLWANYNIGANSPEEYGDKFAWGELEPKSTYNWSTYKYCQGSENTMTKYCVDSSYGIYDGKQTLDLEDDVAYMTWGADWRMPSYEQQNELLNTSYCTWTWTNQNGTDGYLITSILNGNSIFLPTDKSHYGSYWSRSLYRNDSSGAIEISFNSSNLDLYYDDRFSDCAIRPVRNK